MVKEDADNESKNKSSEENINCDFLEADTDELSGVRNNQHVLAKPNKNDIKYIDK